MVKMMPRNGKKSDAVDVLEQNVAAMERRGWKPLDENKPAKAVTDEKVKNDGES